MKRANDLFMIETKDGLETDELMGCLEDTLGKGVVQRIIKLKLFETINKLIKESEEELEKAGTNYLEVLNNEDTTAYGVEAENNNFSAGRISGLKELKTELEHIGIKEVEEWKLM